MIRKVLFRKFKAYRSLDVELEPFTVLVGPNASGKTTLLEGLLLATDVASEEKNPPTNPMAFISPVIRTREGLLTRDATPPLEIGITGNWKGTEAELWLRGAVRKAENPKKEEWVFSISGKIDGQDFRPGLNPIQQRVDQKKLSMLRSELRSTAVLRFEPRRLAEPSYSEEEIPRVDSDGSGLAAVLAQLKLTDDEQFNAIESFLKQIVPTVQRIRVERAAVEQTALRTVALDEQQIKVPETRTLWGNRIVFDMVGAKGVPADTAGEGTLMALGLLAVVMGPSRPKLILLDDVELALHPMAQGKLIQVLRGLQSHNPELQIVATSHSPFILNHLDPKEVRMTFLSENGIARCEKLTAHPEFEKWKDLMSPGEFWSTVGENWLEKVGEASASE
ncbi:AAA family ATPase [Hyalangium rubrum]|uniref:AAA family ATPase n=1 Tax=Hyalangium rubrum TaxID=3103134 RepID=A0ABU5GYK8_9BACT|nr:AAA family ATPase [Hyalangium sp. s54d21]MDY7225969.1 AAA family ATPase [Hyalangium sp. s54d21]